jgi:uncharacterized membrane protein YkvA (DUF1232 family)
MFRGAGHALDAGMRTQIRLAWRLFRDERVSAVKYALPALVALYIVSPIDALPDIFLGPGQLDDLGVVAAAIFLLARLMPMLAPEQVVDEHLRAMGLQAQPASTAAWQTEHVVDATFRVRD